MSIHAADHSIKERRTYLDPKLEADLATLPAFLILRDASGGSVETGTSHPEVIKELAFQIGGFAKSITMVQTGEAMLFYRDYNPVAQTFGPIYA